MKTSNTTISDLAKTKLHSVNNVPLSLYIHFPWCVQKCPYCDFNSHQLKSSKIDERSYIDDLISDLKNDIKLFSESRKLTSIFLGGGTPSLFSGDSIDYLLQSIESQLGFVNDIEITLEANPGTLDISNFKKYLNSGVNRLSIGVQSLNDTKLQKLGRIHDKQMAIRSVKTAQDLGFRNINIDMMYALPEQTINEAISDLSQAIELQTNHLSYYQLTIEPNTAFYNSPPKQINNDAMFVMSEQAFDYLNKSGFKQYEVSAWTKNEKCRHNLNYWEYGDYLGIGAGAHGKTTAIDEDEQQYILRSAKQRSPAQYALGKSNDAITNHSKNKKTLDKNYLQELRLIDNKEKAFEFMLNTLRLKHGFNMELITQRGLFDIKTISNKIADLVDKKLLIIENKDKQQFLIPTKQGYMFLNDVLEYFLE